MTHIMTDVSTSLIITTCEEDDFIQSVDGYIGNEYFRINDLWVELCENDKEIFFLINAKHTIDGFDALVEKEKKESEDLYFPITIKQAKVLVAYLNSCISISETK